jgi:hypothetical protein
MFRDTPIHSRTRGGFNGSTRPANQPAQPLEGLTPWPYRTNGPTRRNEILIQELEDEYEDVINGTVYEMPAAEKESPSDLYPTVSPKWTRSVTYIRAGHDARTTAVDEIPQLNGNIYKNDDTEVDDGTLSVHDSSYDDRNDSQSSLYLRRKPLESLQEESIATNPLIATVNERLRPLLRTIWIFLETIRLLVSPLFTKKLIWVLPVTLFIIACGGTGIYATYRLLSLGIVGSWNTDRGGWFVAPQTPPIDISEYSDRLMSLESQIELDSKKFGSLAEKIATGTSQVEDKLVAGLERLSSETIETLSKQTSLETWIKEAVQKWQQKYQELEVQFHNELKSVSKTLGTLGLEITKMDKQVHTHDTTLRDDRKQLTWLQQQVASQSEDLNGVFKTLDQQAAAIAKKNPSIDAERYATWEAIEEKLAANYGKLHNDIGAQIVEINARLEAIKRERENRQQNEQRIVDQFSELQAGLRALSDRVESVDEKMLSGNAVDSLDIDAEQLRSELDEIRNIHHALSSKMKDHDRQLNEMLATLRDDISSQLDSQKQEVEALDYRIQQIQVSSPTSPSASKRLDWPNFADKNIGAAIDKTITSPIYNPLGDAPFLYRMFRHVVGAGGIGRYILHTDENVLMPNMEVGRCWPFKGPVGNLGVILPTEVDIETVAIDHAYHKAVVDATTAPRRVSFWAEVQDPMQRAALKKSTVRRKSHSDNIGLPDTYVELVSFEYKVFATTETLQQFPIPKQIRDMHLPVRNVVFHFEQNWGNDVVSCIYRVLVFGKSVIDAKPQRSVPVVQQPQASERLFGSSTVMLPQLDNDVDGGPGFGDDVDV